ncbi:hypothetical protein D3C85_1588500 [compost metagenome]
MQESLRAIAGSSSFFEAEALAAIITKSFVIHDYSQCPPLGICFIVTVTSISKGMIMNGKYAPIRHTCIVHVIYYISPLQTVDRIPTI